jgi:hypothetical protein
MDSGNDARVPERDDIRLGVALPPLGGIGLATALMVRRGISAMSKAKPQRQKEKLNEARRGNRISTHKSLPYLLSTLRSMVVLSQAVAGVVGTPTAGVPAALRLCHGVCVTQY